MVFLLRLPSEACRKRRMEADNNDNIIDEKKGGVQMQPGSGQGDNMEQRGKGKETLWDAPRAAPRGERE